MQGTESQCGGGQVGLIVHREPVIENDVGSILKGPRIDPETTPPSSPTPKRRRYSPILITPKTKQSDNVQLQVAEEQIPSSPLSSLPDDLSMSGSLLPTTTSNNIKRKRGRAQVHEEDQESRKLVKTVPLKRGHKSYSGWSCSQAPSNILSMLRFDHPPIVLKLPTQSTVEAELRRISAGRELQSDDGKKVRGIQGKKVDKSLAVIARVGQPGRKEESKQRIQETRQPKDSVLIKMEDTQVVPLRPTVHNVATCPRSRSNIFGKVLRIVADLPRAQIRTKHPTPPPKNRPPVWAESRQELCEALPYYRSFQSGIYMHGKIAYGYLLEAFPAPRDIWAHDGRVIISHGGGQCIKSPTCDISSGAVATATLQADQSRSDARVDTLLLAHEKRTPIILIAGKGYEELPWSLDCAYVVLGWYWISMTWVEAEPCSPGITPPLDRDYFHRYKIRFDWVQSQGRPWWINDESSIQFTKTRSSVSTDNSLSMPPPGQDDSLHDGQILDSSTGEVLQRRDLPCNDETRPQALEEQQAKSLSDGLLEPIDASTGLYTPPPSSSSSNKSSSSAAFDASCRTASRSNNKESKRSCWPGYKQLISQNPILNFNDDAVRPPLFRASTSCLSCGIPIVQVYREGLICLEPTCRAFFMLITPIGVLPIPQGFPLTYSEDFLQPVPTPDEVQIPYEAVPPEPARKVPETDSHGDGEGDGEIGGRTLWRGWVCRKCGRANCRWRWEVWECKNCGDLLHPIDQRSVLLKKDLPPNGLETFMGNSKTDLSSGITSALKWISEIACVCVVYDLPSAGKVYHLIQPHSPIADRLLEEYQIAANEGGWFQRRPLKNTTVKGQLLAQHFAVNFGAAYKYQVDTLSYPFDKAPGCVLMSLALITQLVKLVLGEDVGFNEVLSVMYREGQKMSWHDDGEDGLGPIVSSLSLGNQAIMSFRPKPKTSRVNPYNSFHNAHGSQNHTNAPMHTPPTALSFTLSHGDIMIMQGHDIQRRYDHRVVPSGFRIACTARVIGERPPD
ncbi:uncharacterized protein I303_102716 [Kwoniella dejecticola CBS 10117]|uniref:Fe2OG dioxygenase domain-containing protein n=1 Tax=Kwoniella dejecticola CBS 10117 TaxID=1296121 RepID=A0AAJ8KMF9_9TREE